jgi:exodeoxyribonuclease VII large subunit
VLVWPVRVQGETCAAEVAAAIRGFNALEPGGKIPRPDVLIVARGGGSIEDLWGFNEEIVVRAAAESDIPLVSAVGHETDTTLIDHAADVRAPTPTGAAEMVVPVRVELMAAVNDLSRRHVEAALRLVERRRSDLRATTRAMPGAEALFSPKRQRLDLAATKLYPALSRNARGHEERLLKLARQLAHVSPVANVARMRARLDAVGPRPHNAVCRAILLKGETLKQTGERLAVSRQTLLRAERTRLAQASETAQRVAERLVPALQGQIARKADRLEAVSKLFDSLSYKSVLKRGFALVRDAEGRPMNSAEAVHDGQALVLEFADGKADATGGRIGSRPRPAKPRIVAVEEQGALF